MVEQNPVHRPWKKNTFFSKMTKKWRLSGGNGAVLKIQFSCFLSLFRPTTPSSSKILDCCCSGKKGKKFIWGQTHVSQRFCFFSVCTNIWIETSRAVRNFWQFFFQAGPWPQSWMRAWPGFVASQNGSRFSKQHDSVSRVSVIQFCVTLIWSLKLKA